MSRVLAIARRELEAYFSTVIGWLALAFFVLLSGFLFAYIISIYAQQSTQAAMSPYGGGTVSVNDHVIPDFFGTISVILLFLCPAISMRIFSEDLRQKSMELLLSSPLSSLEIVLGKYIGAVGFLSVLLLGTVHCSALLFWVSTPDLAVLGSAYLSTFLMGAAFLALGMVTSAFTESQLIALGISFSLALLLFFFNGIDSLGGGTLTEVLAYSSVLTHTEQLSKGLLHLKDIVYYTTFIGFFIFATQQRVEAMRWQ